MTHIHTQSVGRCCRLLGLQAAHRLPVPGARQALTASVLGRADAVRRSAIAGRRLPRAGLALDLGAAGRAAVVGYESGMHRGTHQVITLSVKLGEGGFGARAFNLCYDTAVYQILGYAN